MEADVTAKAQSGENLQNSNGGRFNAAEFLVENAVFFIPIFFFVLLSLATPYFFTVENLTNLLLQVTVVGILAVGQTFVVIVAGIDLSVSSLLSLTGCLAIGTYNDFGLLPAIMLTLGVGIVCGFVNGFIVAKARMEPFIVTLSIMSVLQGLALFYTGGYPKFVQEAMENFHPDYGQDFAYIGAGRLFDLIPVPFVILLVLVIAAQFVLSKVRIGRYFFAIGGNRETARLSGISVQRYEILAYVICGFTAAIAGIVYASRIGTGLPNMGLGYELRSIAAVVIGGTTLAGGRGGVVKTLAGTFIFGLLANGLNLLNVSAFYQYVAIGVVILVAVFLNELGRKKLISYR